MGQDGPDAQGEVLAGYLRHQHVRDHQADRIVGFRRDLQSFLAAFRFDDSVASGLRKVRMNSRASFSSSTMSITCFLFACN